MIMYGYERTGAETISLALEMIRDSNPSRERDFMYSGRESLGSTDARIIGVSRDSETLERSNFEVISDDLISYAQEIGEPDMVYIQRYGHWAVGWLDVCHVQMIEDPSLAIVTLIGERAISWLDALADYPVADESHYSELEHGEYVDYLLDDLIPLEIGADLREEYSDQRLLDAILWIFQNSSNVDDLYYEIRSLERAGSDLDSALLEHLEREDLQIWRADQERAGQIRLSDDPLFE